MRRVTVGPSSAGYRNTLLRPPKKTFRKKVKSIFWDQDDKTCLTRTPENWLSIMIYYSIFLASVFLIFFISLKAAEMISTINNNGPHYILGDSPIGASPGLNFFPIKEQSSLIWLSRNRPYDEYVNLIKSEFKQYKEKNSKFNTSGFGSCAIPPFGYDSRTPCIFLRINRVFSWKPVPYDKEDSLPTNVPESVKNEISKSSTSRIWVTCNGTTAKDRDHISEDFFEFQGPAGFDVSFYPFYGQKDFIDPIVALKLKDSNQNEVLYSFKCSAWSKGLDSSVACVEVLYYFE